MPTCAFIVAETGMATATALQEYKEYTLLQGRRILKNELFRHNTAFCFVLTNFIFFFHILKEMEEHMRSMLHHRELENLKGRYESNLASFLPVPFCVSLSGRTPDLYIPYKLNCTIYVSL